MASILGRLPEGLRAIRSHFGDAIELYIIDRRGKINIELFGWRYLSELGSEGGYQDIKRSLAEIVKRDYRAGRIPQEAYEPALGKAPRDFSR
jgi:hypothetical protein